MANIKKELRLVATLDDSAFKRQIEALKKSMGKEFSFDPQNMAGIKDVFKDIAKDFSKELKEALKNVSIGGRGPGGASRGQDDPFIQEAKHKAKLYREQTREQDRMFDKEQRHKAQEFFKEQRGKEKILMKEAQAADKERKKDLDASRDRFEELKKKRAEERLENSRLDRSLTARGMRAAGFGTETARGGARTVEGMFDQSIGRVPPALRIAGGIGAALTAPGMLMSDIRDIRRLQAQREYAMAQSITQQDVLGGMVEQTGRENLLTRLTGGAQGAVGGALKFGAAGAAVGAGIGSIFGGVGAAPGALIGGLLGGGVGAVTGGLRGAFTSAEEEAKTRREQVQPILQAVARAQALAPQRLELMRGGGVTTAGANALQGAGAGMGFTPEETIQQALQARQFLGNRNIGLLSGFQQMKNITGADVGLQAQTAELFAGAGRQSMAAGATQTIEVLKKGVAAGMDVSKSSQFLKTTADYIQATTGFGRVDVSQIADRMASLAQGFAGGGEVTQTTLEQARSLQEMMRSESVATGGIAGLGNIVGIQNAFQQTGQQLDTGGLLALQNLSANASKQDVQEVLSKMGVAPDAMEDLTNRIMQVKQGAAQVGLEAAGLGGGSLLGTALLGRERGITTEQQMGAERALSFKGTGVDADKVMQAAATQVSNQVEYQKAVADSAVAQKQVIAGLGEFGRITEATTKGLAEFNRVLTEASKKLEQYIGSPNISRETK